MKNVWTVLKLGIALLGLLLTGARSSLAQRRKARESLQQPVSQALVEAGEEADTGQHQQGAHDLLDHAQMLGEAAHEAEEPVDTDRRQEEWNAEARRIKGEQNGALGRILHA